MKCENCQVEHLGLYGSGRFCSSKCARGFSAKVNREETSRKVSLSLQKEKRCNFCGIIWWKTAKDRYKANRRCPDCRQTPGKDRPWELVKWSTKRSRLIKERGHRCESCRNETWLDQPIPLELHHLNAIRGDDRKENLQLLCANCHALTANFGWKKKFQSL